MPNTGGRENTSQGVALLSTSFDTGNGKCKTEIVKNSASNGIPEPRELKPLIGGKAVPDPELGGAREEYNPFLERNLPHPTSDWDTFIHLLKGSLGTGILAMPLAFRNAGLGFGLVATFIIGFICTYCVHVLVKCAHELCRRTRTPALGFAEVAEAAFKSGPPQLRRFSKLASATINTFLVVDLLGCCCVYIVFVAKNVQQVVDYYLQLDLDIRYYMLFMLVPLLLLNLIRNLKLMAPFSMVANLLIGCGMAITFYYVFQELPAPSERPMFSSIQQLPLFFGTAIFALEGIGVVQSNASAWSKGVRKKHSPPVQYEVDNQLMQPIAESQILTYSTEGREKMLKETKTFTLNFLQQTPEYRNSSVAGHSIHSGCEQSIEDKTMPRCTNVNTTLVYAPKFNKPPFKERQNEARSNSVSDSKQTATCSVSVQETFSDSMQKTSPNDSGPLFNMELKDLRSKNNSVRATRFYVVPAKRKKSQNESNASVQTHSNHDMESADKDLLMSQKHYVPNELDNSTHAVKHSRSVRKKYHRKPCSSAESKCATRLDDVSNKCPQEIVEINQCSSAEIRSDRRSHKPSQSQFRHKRPPRTTKELDRTRNRDVANYHDSESLEEIHPSRRNKTAVFKNRKWVPQQCSGFTDTLESEMISKRNDEYSESKCIKSSKAQLDRPELEFRNNIRIRRKNFDHKFKDFNSMIQPPPGFTEKPPGFTERIPLGITEKIPPGFTKKTPPGFTKKTPTGFTEKTPPGFIEKTPPGFTEKPPPGFTEKPPPGFTEKPPPGFTEKPPLSFTEKTPPGFTEKPPPGFTEKPPGFTEKPPLSFTEKPPLSFTEKPPPGFTEKPPPNFPSKVHWVKNRYGRTRGEKLNKGQFYRSQSMYHSSNRTGVTEDTDKITIQLDEISKCPSPKSEKCQQSIPFSSIHSGVLEANIHTRNLQFLLQKKCNQDATTDVIEAKNRSDANPLTSDLNIWQEKCVNGKYFETDQVTNNVPVISKRLKNLQLDDWTLQTAATSKSETSTSCSTPAVAMESHLTYDYWDLTYVNSEERDSHLPVKAPVSRSSITEIDGDLFSTTSTTSLVHCVAEDMRMSQGIAIDFRIRFGRVPELLSQNCRVGELAILTEPKHKPERFIYYLVTKFKSSTKPTIQNLENSLLCLREHCLQHHITHLAMPRIGCGLDLLVWSQVKDLLHKIFSDTVVSITVYNYNSESDEDVNVNIKHFCFKESFNCQLSEMVLGTGRVFLASESPMADSTMQDLNTKFLFMPTYVQNVRSKGGVFRYECKLPHEVLYGLIVRGCSIYESVDFLALDTSLRTLRKLIKKDNYLHIGIEAFYQEDDLFVMDKIITAIKWVFAKTDVELYICWSKTVMMQCGRTNI